MTLDEFKVKLFNKAEAAGFSEYEIYYQSENTLSIVTFEGELDKYSVSSSQGISFRGIYKDKMGYSYSEVLDTATIDFLITSAKETAQVIQSEEKEFIFGGDGSPISEFKGYEDKLSKITPAEKIQLAYSMEKAAKAESNKVIRVEATVEDYESNCRIINSKGLDLSYRSNGIFALVEPVVSDNDKMNSSYAFKGCKAFEEIDPKVIAKEAVDESLAYVGAEPVDSGMYAVALRNDASLSLLETFAGIFSADNVQKGLSLLKDKVGTQISSNVITLVDDPLLINGMKSKPFDDEGVAAYTKEVISQGELKTLLYNLKSADKDDVKSTGNGAKASYSSPVEIAPSNFYIKPGMKDFAEILKTLGNGLLITELQGLHAGANPVSGDFSLAAKGFIVKDGNIVRPVDQITIAGNFYKVLEQVIEVGSDLKFGLPSGKGYFGSPTIIIKEISIAGK